MEDRSGLIVPGSPDQRTHKQRMLDGDPFWGPDPVLLADALHASAVCAQHAALFPTDPEAAMVVLRGILRRPGTMFVRPPVTIEFGYQVSLGEGGFINSGVMLVDNAPITIGDGVLIGPGTQLITASHPLDPDERDKAIDLARPIVVGDRAWIGASAIILPGVTIGDAAVVGAGAVVTKDVAPRTVVAGNPARMLRQI